jgi:hypothetical protein
MQNIIENEPAAVVRNPRIRGITADAKALGVTREHLYLVLRGERESNPLKARYLALKQSQQEQRMKKTMKLSPQGRVPMPIEFAALQNLQPSFFQTLTTLGQEVVLVRIDTSKNTPPGALRYTDLDERLGKALQSIEAGQFDSDFYPLHSHCLFFHVDKAKLGSAMRLLKDALRVLGLLEATEIYHAESADFLTQWYPPTAEGIPLEPA